MSTYCNNDELILDTGKSLDGYFDVSLTDLEKLEQKERARIRAFNFINENYLRGKTAVPALHIPALKQVEIDLVIADLMADSFSMEMANTSDWAEKYKERAAKALESLRYKASVDDIVADSENTGNGKVTNIEVKDDFTRTERWILRASSATTFTVYGTLHGYLSNLEVGTKYPEKDWSSIIKDYGLTLNREIRFEEFPISLTITASDIAFSQDDKFMFSTFSASYYKNRNGKLLRG